MIDGFLKTIRQLEQRVAELEKKQLTKVRLDQLVLNEVAAPATPTTGTTIVYVKSDGLLYFKDDVGTERLVSYT